MNPRFGRDREWAFGPFFVGYCAMKQAPAALMKLIEPVVTGLGYEFVGMELVGQGRQSVLRVFIDKEQGILVEDCSRVSHQISGVLDVEDPIRGRFTLEVSSPGIDRPLFTLAHFERFVGSTIKLELNQATVEGQKKFRGEILKVNGEVIHLHVEDEEFEIPFGLIQKARLLVDF